MITATAFSMDLRVTMSRVLSPFLTASTRTRALASVLATFSASSLAIVDE